MRAIRGLLNTFRSVFQRNSSDIEVTRQNTPPDESEAEAQERLAELRSTFRRQARHHGWDTAATKVG
jgi:hypothetical protein